MNKNLLFTLLAIVLVAAAWFAFSGSENASNKREELSVSVKKQTLIQDVTSVGELQAENSVQIYGPKKMRDFGIYQAKIESLVPEGTVVKEGDFVASLDRSDLSEKMKSVNSEIEKAESQLLQTKLDTAIEMRNLRDALVNLQFNMREKELEVEQSKYEPPVVIRQAELELERVKRDYTQQEENYKLRQQQAKAKVREIAVTLDIQRNKLQLMQNLAEEFTIMAPQTGMVIYQRDWEGRKKGAGGQLNAWNPVVAELPDLSSMISVTYVNEVDISNIKKGQSVKVKVDAFPDKSFKGKVVALANVGEQRPNFDAMVFEVTVQLLHTDSTLRPAMTTSNTIHLESHKDVLTVPLEAIQQADSSIYVLKKEDKQIVKQVVTTGEQNDMDIIVTKGLLEGDEVLLSVPKSMQE